MITVLVAADLLRPVGPRRSRQALAGGKLKPMTSGDSTSTASSAISSGRRVAADLAMISDSCSARGLVLSVHPLNIYVIVWVRCAGTSLYLGSTVLSTGRG